MPDRLSDEMMGPCMRALRGEKQRVFAFIMGCGEINATKAAREAGYADPGHGASLRVQAHALVHDPAVIAAVREVAGNVLMGLAPKAIAAAKEILDDKRHPARARMIETVLDRTGFFARTEHTVRVEHEHRMQVEATEAVLLRIRALAAAAGLNPATLPPVIDAVANELAPAQAGDITGDVSRLDTRAGDADASPAQPEPGAA
jgi:phage terminase small subunit